MNKEKKKSEVLSREEIDKLLEAIDADKTNKKKINEDKRTMVLSDEEIDQLFKAINTGRNTDE